MRNHRLIERGALIFGLCILILGAITVSRVASQARQNNGQDEFWEFAYVFNEIFHTIQDQYVEEVDAQRLYRGAIQGMFNALDTHSAYMGPDSFDQLEKETEGEFSGVGLHITLRDGILTVIAPIPGGPSAKLGIEPWDRIIEIEGESTEGISLTEAVRKLTGPRGTIVKVKIWRPGMMEGEELEIERDVVKIQSVFHDIIDEKIGYIRISKFSDKVSREVLSMINDMRDKGVRGLILDLRFNPGGLLSEAIKISDLFLPRDSVIVSTRGRDEKLIEEYKAQSDAVIDWPIMILVNQGSASASEIVTAALRDHNRALVIGPEGESTFGKGSVQTIAPLNKSFERDEDGNLLYGAIKLTTALYFTPGGETIHQVGIKPDIGVPIPSGHNRELLQRGLLGDPDLRGPDNGNTENNGGNDETDTEERPEPEAQIEIQDGEGPGVEAVPFYLPENGSQPKADESAEEGEEPFHDIMLEESVRLMKAYLILGSSGMRQISSR